jgi:hypothetical protein
MHLCVNEVVFSVPDLALLLTVDLIAVYCFAVSSVIQI